MTKLLIQHGPAKGQKIDNAFDRKCVQGVIFSPRDERIESIKQYCDECKYLSKENSFVDPQFYYSTYSPEVLKLLNDQFEFPQKVKRMDWRKKSDRLIKYFNNYSEYVRNISNSIITPGFCVDSIDWKFDYSIDIYEYFKENYEFEQYYMSLMISSETFHSKNDIEDILEELKESVDKKSGIYLVIKYPNSNIKTKNYESIDAETLSNILYFVYSLRNYGFKIIVGYTFLNSILFSMLGCEYVATGWFNNLRKFEQSKFENADSFGIRKKRYVSIPTLTYMTLELINDCKDIDITQLYSGTEIDEIAIEDHEKVSFVDLEQEYWQALNNIINKLNEKNTTKEKVKYIKECIERSIGIYEQIINVTEGKIELQNRVKLQFKHIYDWKFAIELFEKKLALL